MQTTLNPCSLPLRVGQVRAPKPCGALASFLPPTILQCQPVRAPGRPRGSRHTRVAAAAARDHGACVRAEFLHRLQDFGSRTCTMRIRARMEELWPTTVYAVCVGPLQPGIWRHTLRHAKPLECRRLSAGWRDGCGCTQTAEARRHRRSRACRCVNTFNGL